MIVLYLYDTVQYCTSMVKAITITTTIMIEAAITIVVITILSTGCTEVQMPQRDTENSAGQDVADIQYIRCEVKYIL
jgi:hypothetical protein